MIDNVVYERSVPECAKIGYLQQKKIQKISHSPRFAPHPHSKILGTPLKWKVGASASVCRVTLCVYCWVHFMSIAKMYGNLFSGRPSKVLPWYWLKSLGLGIGLEVQSLGLGLDKKVLFTSLVTSRNIVLGARLFTDVVILCGHLVNEGME